MSNEELMRKGAKLVTGDDEILDVAEFMPKGSMGAGMAGAAAGSLAGGDSAWGQGFAGAGGAFAGSSLNAAVKGLPKYICVAVSPDTVYLMGIPMGFVHGKFDEMMPIAKIERAKLGVEVHQRATVRVVILEDLDTGAKFELETPRVNLYHSKAMVELLMLSDHHHDEEEADLSS